MNHYQTVQLAKTISASVNNQAITDDLKTEVIQKEALSLIAGGAQPWKVFEFACRFGTLTGYRA